MKRLKIGVLQQHNIADGADNKTRLAEGIKALAEKGAQLIVLQELHNTLYFCQTEDVKNFDLAETIPGPSTEFFGALAKQLNVVIVISLLRNVLLDYITILLSFWRKTEALQELTEKCIFLMILHIMRNSISLQAIWDFVQSKHLSEHSA